MAVSLSILFFIAVIWVTLIRGEEGVHLRKLMGSNCVLIERGIIPPYYDCIGCVVEEAAACLNDMRYNFSFNVAQDCRMFSVKQFYDRKTCCPRFGINDVGAMDLAYIGAAYPEALRCMERVGCGGSIMYSQLKEECTTTCLEPDPRNGGNVCFSNFNAASAIRFSAFWTVAAIAALIVYSSFT
jgi:hypothetical protein